MPPVLLRIESCLDCPHHKKRADPDPHDSFCRDDMQVLCGKAGRAVASSCRPYNMRREALVPPWCPLREEPGSAEAVVRGALEALCDNRDFLGYQLSHASGTLDQKDMDELAELYLAMPDQDPETLRRAAQVLVPLVPAEKMDSELLSVLLRCDVDVARGILADLAGKP